MSLGTIPFIVLTLACLIGSGVSVVAGFGGGILIFAALAAVLDFAYVIPMHGAVTLIANMARVWLFWKDVDRAALKAFLITFMPSAVLSTVAWYFLIETEAAQPYIKMSIAVCLILFVAMPDFRIKSTNRFKIMAMAGLACGLPVMLFNVGPLLVPFLIALNLKKNAFIGTFAFIGMVITASKVPLFLFIWDRLSLEIGVLVAVMALGVVLGTYGGKLITGRVSESLFKTLVNVILVTISLKLLIWDGVRVIFSTG